MGVSAKILFAICLLNISSTAFAANGCPYGESPTGPRSDANPLGCVPDPQAENNGQPAQPSGRWETRWGAIASHNKAGTLGAVTNFASKRQAKKAALAECKANGGSADCQVLITYYNKCAVVAWGDSYVLAQGKETIAAATQLGLSRCGEKTTNCKIVYTECSLPVWVQ
jgi:Domain of unknown function (DUF4189)